MTAPVASHFQIEKRRAPGNQYQSGERLESCEIAHVTHRHDVAEAQCGETGEREIDTIEQRAVKVALKISPAGPMVHPVVSQCENPDLNRMGAKGGEYTDNNSKAVADIELGHQHRKAIQEFVVNQHDGHNDHDIDENDAEQRLDSVCRGQAIL